MDITGCDWLIKNGSLVIDVTNYYLNIWFDSSIFCLCKLTKNRSMFEPFRMMALKMIQFMITLRLWFWRRNMWIFVGNCIVKWSVYLQFKQTTYMTISLPCKKMYHGMKYTCSWKRCPSWKEELRYKNFIYTIYDWWLHACYPIVSVKTKFVSETEYMIWNLLADIE